MSKLLLFHPLLTIVNFRRLEADVERPDFLQKMISEREKTGTTIADLRAQASLLTIAGGETTATAPSGIMYYLRRTPRAHGELAREIRQNFSHLNDISGRATEALPYLHAVIKEGLRIYPPVPVGLPRLSNGAMVAGHYVPEGTVVYVTSWAATHSEENFHRPFDFIPERWLDSETGSNDKKRASQPYLLGSRVCLGRK